MTFAEEDPVYVTFSPKIMYIIMQYTALCQCCRWVHVNECSPIKFTEAGFSTAQRIPLQLSFRFLLIGPQDSVSFYCPSQMLRE